MHHSDPFNLPPADARPQKLALETSFYAAGQIRRRQRKAFLALNAEQGLYFTPRLYDGFMSLLQRAKAMALNAEAGNYDNTETNQDLIGGTGNGAGAGDGAATTSRQELQVEAETGTAGEGVKTAVAAGETIAAAATLGLSRKGRGHGGKGGAGSEDAGDHSECSTRPVSARSSSGGEDEDEDEVSDDGGRREGRDEVSDTGRQDGNADNDAAMENSNTPAAASEGDPPTVPGETKRPAGNREAGEGAEDAGGTATEQKDGGAEGDGSGCGTTEESEESQARAETLLLREMLERLDCEEWDGAVSTVLDAIEGLTRWIPPPPSAEPGTGSRDAASRKTGGGDSDLGAGLAPASTARSRSDAGDRSGGEGESVASNDDQEEGNEQDKEGDEDEEEDEEDDEDDEDEDEEEGEGEGDDQSEVEAGQQHPVLVEQRALREQWRRLVLDAQLEPETDCTVLMREAIESMIDDVAGAMEIVRKEAAAGPAAGGGGKSAAAATAAEAQNPRGGVLGYDEVIT